MAIKTVQATNYEPGTAVFVSIIVPGDQATGCKARYDVDVYQGGFSVRQIRGANYDPGSPGNDTFPVLSSMQATPVGALLRLTVYLQQMNSNKYTFEVAVNQGARTLYRDKPGGTLASGKVEVIEYDIFCS